MEKKFIGRIEEINILNKCCISEKNEMIAVYGRRRVGKTYLVRETLGERIDFSYTGMYKGTSKNQIREFQKEIDEQSGSKYKIPCDWFCAFENLRRYLLSLKKDVVIVFLDELPWMDTPKSNFLNAFSLFWNNWGREKTILKLIVCGSSTTWMADKLIGDRGGLYGRVTRPIYLAPFTLHETECFLNDVKKMNYGHKNVLDAYMILGGIPYYLDMLDKDLPLSLNVDRLFFRENAPLRSEYDFLFRSLFRNSENYRKVIRILSSKLLGMTREEISDLSGITGGELTKMLKNLCACDFVRSYSYPENKERNKIYQLIDMYSLFYLRFLNNESGQDENYWTNLGESGKKKAWQGYAFEQVCLHHIRQIKKTMGISGILSNVYALKQNPYVDSCGNEWKGCQIDLIIDRSDNVINLCEMKYSSNEYIIDREYEKTLRERMQLFKIVKKTKKDLKCTFVTTYGVKNNMYSGIVDNNITLDDLFQD